MVNESISEKEKLRYVVVTGGNAGIGKALCKQLVTDHNCKVFMGSRSLERGTQALKEIISHSPKCQGMIQVIQLDVSDEKSVLTAAIEIKGKLGDAKLYGLVNNAGVMSGVSKEVLIKTNFYGPKYMTEAFVPLICPNQGRIVNMGSGLGPNFVAK